MKVKTASRLGEVKEYYFSIKLKEIARMRADGVSVLNLGIGSPDLPPAPGVVDTLSEHSLDNDNHAYQSYSGLPELRSAFAKWYQEYFGVSLDPDSEVLPLIGSKEGIMHISMTYVEAGDEVLVPNPGYPAYRAVTKLTGANIKEYLLTEEHNWLPDLEALERQDLTKVKIMWVNYPHMPTGTAAPADFFERLVAFAKRHEILIVNDNPYSFILNDKPRSIFAVDGAKEVALELNSLSKSHNMAGWRVGALLGASHFLQDVLRFKSNMDSGMFKPLQLAAAQALANPKSWYDGLNQIYRSRQQKVFDIMKALNCTFDESQIGMFVWAKIPEHYKNSFEVTDIMLHKAHIFITPGGIFGSQGDRYIRISLCSDIVVFMEALRRIEEITKSPDQQSR